MRSALCLCAAALAVTATPAAAAVNVYNATLTGAQEVPANNSPASGVATVTVDDVLNTLRVQLTFSGLQSATVASHIHCCAPVGASAIVATRTPTFPFFPSGVTAGVYDQTFDLTDPSFFNASFITANGGTLPSARATLLTGLANGLAYVNVHTVQNPGGEIRGQLLAAVPEPGSWLLMLVGFGAMGWAVRRQEATGRLRRAVY